MIRDSQVHLFVGKAATVPPSKVQVRRVLISPIVHKELTNAAIRRSFSTAISNSVTEEIGALPWFPQTANDANLAHRRQPPIGPIARKRLEQRGFKMVMEDNLNGLHKNATQNSIEVLVFRLRRRLEQYGSDCSIHTLHGIGYLIKEN